jgi:rod shape-determining protein MreD
MARSDQGSIAVYRVHPATVWITVFVALLIQSFLPVRIPLARLIDFPLLAVVYFSLLRRSQVFGTLTGMVTGLVQDFLSHGPIGMFGMTKALAGYVAAYASIRFDPEQMVGRFLLVAVFVLLHNLFLLALQQLLPSPPPFEPLDLAVAVLVNVAMALVLFQILDRFRHPA